MQRLLCFFIFIIYSFTAKPQQKKDSLLIGNWEMYRMENSVRLLDFEDTVASINHMMNQYRIARNTQQIPVDDSLQMVNEFLQILPAAQLMRFKIQFKKDNSFTWKGSFNDPFAEMSGEYMTGNDEIAFTETDPSTKEKQTIRLTLLLLTENKLVFIMPYNGKPKSEWTLSFKKL